MAPRRASRRRTHRPADGVLRTGRDGQARRRTGGWAGEAAGLPGSAIPRRGRPSFPRSRDRQREFPRSGSGPAGSPRSSTGVPVASPAGQPRSLSRAVGPPRQRRTGGGPAPGDPARPPWHSGPRRRLPVGGAATLERPTRSARLSGAAPARAGRSRARPGTRWPVPWIPGRGLGRGGASGPLRRAIATGQDRRSPPRRASGARPASACRPRGRHVDRPAAPASGGCASASRPPREGRGLPRPATGPGDPRRQRRGAGGQRRSGPTGPGVRQRLDLAGQRAHPRSGTGDRF